MLQTFAPPFAKVTWFPLRMSLPFEFGDWGEVTKHQRIPALFLRPLKETLGGIPGVEAVGHYHCRSTIRSPETVQLLLARGPAQKGTAEHIMEEPPFDTARLFPTYGVTFVGRPGLRPIMISAENLKSPSLMTPCAQDAAPGQDAVGNDST